MMPKPKKGEIYATYNNDFCFEKGLELLQKIRPDIEIEPLDSHTVKILLKKKDSKLGEFVKSVVRETKGYVEHDLETINALKIPKGGKRKGEEGKKDSGVLDTPFYG